MRKYNPALSSLVDNHRQLAKENGYDLTSLTNEQVYAILEGQGVAPTNDEQEAWFIDDVKFKFPHLKIESK